MFYEGLPQGQAGMGWEGGAAGWVSLAGLPLLRRGVGGVAGRKGVSVDREKILGASCRLLGYFLLPWLWSALSFEKRPCSPRPFHELISSSIFSWPFF